MQGQCQKDSKKLVDSSFAILCCGKISSMCFKVGERVEKDVHPSFCVMA